jgi:hypothetical protein
MLEGNTYDCSKGLLEGPAYRYATIFFDLKNE